MTTDDLIEALEDAGYEWKPYSGRGMNGAYCVSVRLENVSKLFKLGRDIGVTVSRPPELDHMGKTEIVAYWPMCAVDPGAQT